MKIGEFGPLSSTSGTKKRGSVSSAGGFADLLGAGEAENTEQPATTSSLGATANVGNLLALQEMPEENAARKKWLQKGKNLLNELEKLRGQLLTGLLSPLTLRNLSRELAEEKQGVIDPELTALIEEIELRAAVELAKLEMAVK